MGAIAQFPEGDEWLQDTPGAMLHVTEASPGARAVAVMTPGAPSVPIAAVLTFAQRAEVGAGRVTPSCKAARASTL